MTTIAKFERLTISQAENESSSQLFVLNKSNPRGNINFVVIDRANRKSAVQVPVTFIPVDLTISATKQDVITNPDFRRLVARGFLHIVSADSAEKFLQDPKAEKEFNRLFEVLSDNSTDMVENVPGVDQFVNAEAPKSESGNINQFAQNIVLRSAEENIGDLTTELHGKLDTLSKADVQYIMNNTASSELKSWCSEALEIMDEQ